MNDNTIAVEIGETTYTLRRRLGWYDQGKIDEREFRMFVNGKDLARVDENLENLEEIEIRMTTTDRNLSRLQARLVGLSTSKIKNIPPAHIPILLEKIEELERETLVEVRELREGNPTEKQSSG
jgi:hypothetical protein